MSIEAMWTAKFQSNMGASGAGIIVLETQRIFGGDSWHYYVGNYRADNGNFSAQLTVTRYVDDGESI